MGINYTLNKECPICLSSDNLDFIDLKKYPITEIFLNSPDLSTNKKYFINQKYIFCNKCVHAYIYKILDPKVIYNNYWTTTSDSAGASICLQNFCSFIKKTTNINNYDNIIDIGGNDSSSFESFKDYKINRINIDPNASSKNDKNIKLINQFIEEIDYNLFKQHKNLFLSSHTLEHLAKPTEFLSQITSNLKKNDILYLQFPSIEKQINLFRYDQITHQHINLFSLKSIQELLNRYKIIVEDYEYDDSLYGTLRIKCRKIFNSSNKIAFKQKKFNFIKNYKLFTNFFTQLNDILNNSNEEFIGFGAGLMVPTLGYNLPFIKSLKFICDDNLKKINKYYPGFKSKIIRSKYINAKSSVLITSVSTKLSNRKILNKLENIGVANICNPIIFN